MPRNCLEGGVAVLDGKGDLLQINEPLSHWLERPASDLIGQPFWELLGAISPEWGQTLGPARQRCGPFERLDLHLPAKDPARAQYFTLEITRLPQNTVLRLSSILPPANELASGLGNEPLEQNIPRRDLLIRLLRAEARLEALTGRSPCVVFSQRPDFTLQFASPHIKEITGIAPAEWTGATSLFWDSVHESDSALLQQQFKRAAETGAALTTSYRVRHALTGRVAYVLEYRQPTLSRKGALLGYEVVWLDITRQTVAEKRLAAAAWKETLAVLTLGLAHDFTNVITGIHSLSESFLSSIDAAHPFHEGLTLIEKNSMQASQLVRRMMDLHLGQTGERNYHDLNDIAKDLVELGTKTLPRRIRLCANLAGGALPVYVDVVEFRQVVINLMLNAAAAMPQSGCLTLRTSRHETVPAPGHVKGVIPRAPAICLTIQDTGCGIKDRHLDSIFEPFFTTKAKGSGLGLYNARIAIEKHQGAISVISEEGTGTQFSLWLAQADFSESARADKEARQTRSARQTLLLLGLPGEVLDKTAELLRSHNYHTVIAGTDIYGDLLQSGDYQFAGIVLLAEANDRALSSTPGEIRQLRRDIKIVLKPTGCSPDDLDPQLLRGADLVLNPDLSESDMLSRLKTFFEQNG